MVSKIQKRIDTLQLSIKLLEDHLHRYGHLITSKPRHFINNQINNYRRELQIRTDYPY